MAEHQTPGDASLEEVHSLLYLSEERTPFSEASLQQLAVESAASNVLLDLSGYLSYRNSRFTQYLEGPEHEVSAIMGRIQSDHRHRVLTIAHLGLAHRRFPGWSMRRLDPLWHPLSGPLETIEEILTLTAGSEGYDDAMRETLKGLVKQIRRLDA